MEGLYQDKVNELAKRILKFGKKRNHLANKKTQNPDTIVPEGIEPGNKEHRLNLFHSISLDSARKSEEVYRAMREIHKKLGSLEKLIEIKKEELENLLVPYFGEAVKNSKSERENLVKTLLLNTKKLKEEYNGDPIDIYQGEVQKTLKEIEKFRQYGLPKASLLMKNFVRFGIWDFHETEIPIKIDRHILRISFGYGAIDTERYAKVPDWNEENGNKIPNALLEAKNKLIRMKYLKKENFEKGEIRIIRTSKFVKPLTEANIEFTKDSGISAIVLDDLFYATGSIICNQNDTRACSLYCSVNCQKRMPSDNNATYFFPDIDKRKHQNHMLKD